MKTLCLVCQNVDCKNRGSEQLMAELQKRVEAKGLADVEVKPYMCFGACQEGPNIVLYPEKELVRRGESRRSRRDHRSSRRRSSRPTLRHHRFLVERTDLPTSRHRGVLNHGRHPFPSRVVEGREGLKEYQARGGYEALAKALKSTPEDIIKEVADAGLRGRGGAGFPTGKKWAFTRECPEQPRYLVLNGGEDEPGSKKDRMLMEHLPHLVIEGVILSAYAIGASKAYLYINANYEAAIKSINDALAEAKAAGYWGDNHSGK